VTRRDTVGLADDYLALEPPPPLDPTIIYREPVPPRKAGADLPRRHTGEAASRAREAAQLRRRFSFAQRSYMDAMVACRFHHANAGKMLHRAGFDIDKETRGRWRKRPDFLRAMLLAEESLLEQVGLTPAKVLLRVDALAEHAAEEIELRTRKGELLTDELGSAIRGIRNFDGALKANELLGKHHRLWGDEDRSTRVVINVIDMTGSEQLRDESSVVDGEIVNGG